MGMHGHRHSSLHRVQAQPAMGGQEVEVRVQAYSACMDVLDSDHKPVWASLAVSLPVMKQAEQRRLVSALFARMAEGQPATPAASLSASKVLLGQVQPSHTHNDFRTHT